MSALVAYGGSDEEDAVESFDDGKQASEVRLRLSSPRSMAMADCIDLRLQLRQRTLVMRGKGLRVSTRCTPFPYSTC